MGAMISKSFLCRKHADRARADRAEAWREADAAEAEAGVPSMFSFINNSLGGGSEAAALKRRQHGAFATRSEAPVELFPGHAPSGADPLAQNHANGASHRASSGEQPGGSKYFGASTGSKGGKPKGSQHDGRALLAQQVCLAKILHVLLGAFFAAVSALQAWCFNSLTSAIGM